MFTSSHVKVIVFPQLEAGDTAVYTIKKTSKRPIYPGQFWYGDLFPRTAAFDEVRETITAPESMKLYVSNVEVGFSKEGERRKDDLSLALQRTQSAPARKHGHHRFSEHAAFLHFHLRRTMPRSAAPMPPQPRPRWR